MHCFRLFFATDLSCCYSVGVGARANCSFKALPTVRWWVMEEIKQELWSELGSTRADFTSSITLAPPPPTPIVIVVNSHSDDVAATFTSLGLASPTRVSTPSLFFGFWFLPPSSPGSSSFGSWIGRVGCATARLSLGAAWSLPGVASW